MKQHFDRRIEKSRRDAELSRRQIIATLGEIRHRIDPRVIVKEAADDALAQVSGALSEAKSIATSKPWLLAAGATIAGLAITYGTTRATGLTGTADAAKQPNAPKKVERRDKEI